MRWEYAERNPSRCIYSYCTPMQDRSYPHLHRVRSSMMLASRALVAVYTDVLEGSVARCGAVDLKRGVVACVAFGERIGSGARADRCTRVRSW